MIPVLVGLWVGTSVSCFRKQIREIGRLDGFDIFCFIVVPPFIALGLILMELGNLVVWEKKESR